MNVSEYHLQEPNTDLNSLYIQSDLTDEGLSLDNRTNIATPPPVSYSLDLETSEITPLYDPTLKWQLQALARVALGVYDDSYPYEDAPRIRICYRHHRSDKSEVQVRQREDKRTYYANLMTCGSVWCCPVCATKIQAYRAKEVRAAIDAWQGDVLMATYTVPHTRYDLLSDSLSAFNEAMRKLTNGAPWKRLKERYRVTGQIKALEVTWGKKNGWHVHAHVIYFVGKNVSLADLKTALFKRWQSATARAGFGELSPDAFTLQDASQVHSYLTKMGAEYQWNAEHELVKSHSKKASGGNYSPFDFLRANLDESRPDLLAHFAEFAFTFHGRNQLTWSRGLKKLLLGSDGLTDEQVASSIGENDPVLSYIPLDHWRYIRQRNMQAAVLQIAELLGAEGVENLLKGLRDQHPELVPYNST